VCVHRMTRLLSLIDWLSRFAESVAVFLIFGYCGLLPINVVGSTLFAAVSGSSAATTAIVGKVSLPDLGQNSI